MKAIRHLVFLIHPSVYEGVPSERITSRGYEIYMEREQAVKPRWLAALECLDEDTLFLQLGGPKYFQDLARQRHGEANTCWVEAEFPGPDAYPLYYQRLVDSIRGHLARYELEVDTAAVTSELWGESFEGCVAGYGGAFAQYLGLQRPPKLVFEMTVFDTRFLNGARRWETICLPGSDIEGWVFDCFDGLASALFQARLVAQWLDRRPILLQLDPTKALVCTKLGFTVWPPSQPRKGDPSQLVPVAVTTVEQLWIRAFSMSFDALREVVASAKVCP